MTELQLHRFNDNVHTVLTADGTHVGNLKRIGAVWKFKAIGYDACGEVEPGGGPLTDRHNVVVDTPTADALNSAMQAAPPTL